MTTKTLTERSADDMLTLVRRWGQLNDAQRSQAAAVIIRAYARMTAVEAKVFRQAIETLKPLSSEARLVAGILFGS